MSGPACPCMLCGGPHRPSHCPNLHDPLKEGFYTGGGGGGGHSHDDDDEKVKGMVKSSYRNANLPRPPTMGIFKSNKRVSACL